MKFIITSLAFLIPLVAFTQDIIILKSGDTLHGQIVSTDEDGSIVHFKNKNEQIVSISSSIIKQKNSTVFNLDTIPQGWVPGYICLKGSPDSIRGYLKIKTYKSYKTYKGKANDAIVIISFRKNIESKKGTMSFGGSYNYSDTLRYFGFNNRHYKYINYKDKEFQAKWYQYSNQISGWVEIKQRGAINLCRGFSIIEGYKGPTYTAPVSGATTSIYGGETKITIIPMYSLKEGDAPTALIAAPSLSWFGMDDYMLYEVDEKNKEHFINQINENSALAKRVSSQKLLFGDIEGIVKEYNQWKQSKR